ncbi:MAG TPA: TatD family hydrolase [Anaerolineaceae bacterium]|nr:TatD family hydrolase [Anaerolineaceae bacterium]
MDVLVDSHCHLNLNLFENDLPEVLDRAIQRDVARILVPGVDLESSRRAVQLSKEYPILSAAVGIHPNDAATWNEDSLSELKELALKPGVVAIGEIGLDYYRDSSPRHLQMEIFLAQLSLAKEVQKPVIIHSRQSLQDLWQILLSWQQELVGDQIGIASHPGVLHSYEGDLDTALQAISFGFFIGVSGPVTFQNAMDRQAVVSRLPLENILIETDAPYLTPSPFRGRRNEPGYVVYVAEKIAELKKITFSETAAITTHNANRFFGWRADD